MERMTAETYYDGKLLHTDYYMTKSQWEKQFYDNAKKNFKRNLKRHIRRKARVLARKAEPFFYAGMVVTTLLAGCTIFGIIASAL